MVNLVNQVHMAVDRWRHGPWWTMDRGMTEAHRSARQMVLCGMNAHRG
jgi:hypothetical protein